LSPTPTPTPVNAPPHVYSSIGYDRAAEKRDDAAYQAATLRDPETRFLVLHGLKPLFTEDEAGPRPLFIAAEALAGHRPEEPFFLGRYQGRAVFAVDLDGAELEGGTYLELRAVGPGLERGEAGLLAFARALAHWRLRHRYCGACGGPMVTLMAGHCRRCEACGFDTFPRTDPAVICLVVAGEHCLLGRSRHFVQGMFSTLAGFVEPGESLEQTVAREVHEETAVRVRDCRYIASQPWPFPSALMLGFVARAEPQVPVAGEELEAVRWFDAEAVRAGLARDWNAPQATAPQPQAGAGQGAAQPSAEDAIVLSPRLSIARWLIESWLAAHDSRSDTRNP
jgi:NAD+ diphosphatase